MEIQSKHLPGLAVFSVADGKKLGQVKDYVLDLENRAIAALVIGGKKRFREEFLLPYDRIKGISQEAITVENADDLGKKQDFPHLASMLKSIPDLSGNGVMTEHGIFLGKTSNFTIDSDTGKIQHLILKNGFFDDLLRGKPRISVTDVTVFGTDVILTADGSFPCPTGGKGKKTEEKPSQAPQECSQPPSADLKIPSFKGTRRVLKAKTEAWKQKGYGSKIAALSRKDQKVCSEIIPQEEPKPQPSQKNDDAAAFMVKETASAPEHHSKRAKAGIIYRAQK